MRVKEIANEDFLLKKLEELQDTKATISEFEDRMTTVINDKNLTDEVKVLLIRSAFTRTIGSL